MPPNHEIFKGLSSHQWFWCAHMLALDDKEEYERQRHLLEYQISFVPGSGEAVKRVWEDRENKNTISSTEDDFAKTLEMLENNVYNNKLDEISFIPEKING